MTVWLANVLEQLVDFSLILNMSIAASWVVLAVIVLRFLLRKIPKWIHVALWGIVAVRLVFPFSIESAFSLIPSAQTVPQEILKYEGAQLEDSAHLEVITNPIFSSEVSVELGQTIDHVQVQLVNMTSIWLLGIAIMILYTIISYWNLHRKIETAVLYKDNIFQSEYVGSPFVLGVIKPKIYLPFHMNEQDMQHVIAHEQAHMKRKDHWWKPFGFMLLTIHWFNPLMWVAYVLFCRDMELACDEKVVKEWNAEQRADYSQALLTCSVNRHRIAACPLAFGEIGVKDRVKSVLHYKKPAFWMVLLAIAVSIVFAACFLTNPVDGSDRILDKIWHQDGRYEIVEQHNQEVTLTLPVSKLPEQIFTEEGVSFGEKELIAYQDENTTIYLKKAQYSNEGEDNLYFCFDFAFDLPQEQGSFFYPHVILGENSSSYGVNALDGILRADNAIFEDAVNIRGQDYDHQIWFYVSTEALRQAEGTIQFDIVLNRIRYALDPVVHVVDTIKGNLLTYNKMSDGTWQADGHTYKYRLEITGRGHNAIADSTLVYLSNIENITFEQALKAAGLSSNIHDYFDPEDAVCVEWRVEN